MIAALWKLFPQLGDTRAEWRAQGCSEAEIAANTERLVRHELEALVPPEAEWPEALRRPRCAWCQGTGLVLHFRVRDRLGIVTTQGTPCRCTQGVRYLPKAAAAAEDFTAAGKTPKTQPTRFGR